MGVRDLFHDMGYWLKPSRIPLLATLLSPVIAPAVAQTPGPIVVPLVTSGTVEGLNVHDQFVLYSGPFFQTPRDTVTIEGSPALKGYYSVIDDISNPLELIARDMSGNFIAHTTSGTSFWATNPPTYDNHLFFEPIQVGATTLERLLLQNPAPNPFTSHLARTIEIPSGFDAKVEADMYDISGRNIRQLYLGRTDGSLQITWDGRLNNGQVAAPGVYFFRIRVEGFDDNNKSFTLNNAAKVVKTR
ncbi:MAG: FlgD immunoglobulin-like domain containing protein [Candidatus Woesearchaeota archaeon]